MLLTPGNRIGTYEIVAAIGAGGMGEVYRARDTKLRRDVAIKVARDRFSERFGREAPLVFDRELCAKRATLPLRVISGRVVERRRKDASIEQIERFEIQVGARQEPNRRERIDTDEAGRVGGVAVFGWDAALVSRRHQPA